MLEIWLKAAVLQQIHTRLSNVLTIILMKQEVHSQRLQSISS